MSDRLILVQGQRGEWLAAAHRARGDSGFACRVLLVGAEKEAYLARFAGELRSVEAEFVDIERLADAAESRVRAEVPTLVAGIPRLPVGAGERLADSLADRRGNSWWLLDASEKSPFQGTLVANAYILALLRSVLEVAPAGELWVDVHDPGLRAAVLDPASDRPPVGFVAAACGRRPTERPPNWLWHWIYGAAHFARWAWLRILLGGGQAHVARGSIFFFTVFPHWWLGAFSPRPVDRFFPELPERLGEARTLYFAWLNLGVAELWRRRRELRAMSAGKRWLFAQQQLDLHGVASLLSPRRLLRGRRFWRNCVERVSPFFAGFAIREIALGDIRDSLGGRAFARNLLLMRATEKLSAAHPAAVVYREECQPVERALLLGAGVETMCVGFRHIALDRNYLPLHFASGELRDAFLRNDALAPPVPDALLAPGEACARLPIEQGYPPERVFLCGPARHSSLIKSLGLAGTKSQLRAKLGLSPDERVLFVATSVSREESEALLESLLQAGPALPSLRRVLRLHPAGKARDDLVEAMLDHGRSIICPDGAMYDYLAAADAMVTTGSTIAFEAMALGVMPVVFEWPGAFTGLSFADYREACFVARGIADLQRALNSILAGDEAASARRSQWPATLESVFRDLNADVESQFVEGLRRALSAGVARPRLGNSSG